ncbi:MAG: type I pantothenate kinase [Gemmatimonadaceae bacterium]
MSAPEVAEPSGTTSDAAESPYVAFPRDEWAKLRDSLPLALSEAELIELRGVNEEVSLGEVRDIYLPLSRLINLYVVATRGLHRATATFLGAPRAATVPYVIGIAGSVAAGKSTTARVLRALLARWPDHPSVELITTDGFLYPNQVLEARGLMHRKGFPESYDLRALVRFVASVKSGHTPVVAPVYSHLTYDIVPGEAQSVHRPDIVLIEGLNVLQRGGGHPVLVSDFFDFSIYVDAGEEHLRSWYVNRFLALRETVFRDPASYFHRYAALSTPEAIALAERIWREINEVNLRENIEPTRERADLILEKGDRHSVQRVRLRKL